MPQIKNNSSLSITLAHNWDAFSYLRILQLIATSSTVISDAVVVDSSFGLHSNPEVVCMYGELDIFFLTYNAPSFFFYLEPFHQ